MTKNAGSKTLVNILIDGISEIFMPIVNLLSAAGILKGILLILTTTGCLTEETNTYAVLNAIGDSLFYFLPIILAVTSAKKFGANPYSAMVVGGVLVYPVLVQLMKENSFVDFLGIPLKSVSYLSGVLPILMACGLLAAVEKLLNRIIPEVVRGFLTPMLAITFVSLITLAFFGPIGAVIGDGLVYIISFLYNLSPVIAGLILGAAIQIMVIFGFHWGIIIAAMNNVAASGSDTILALIGPPVFAQAGANIAVMLKTKDKKLRSSCLSCAVSSVFGVTEPSMFGINLPRKMPMVAVCIGGGLGGAIAGFSGARAHTFAFPSLASLPVYFGEGFGLYLIACLASFAAAFILSLIFKYKVDLPENPTEEIK